MFKKVLLTFVFIFSVNFSLIRAQHFTHDIGAFGGFSIMQTDYGVRGDFKSSFGNGSTSFSLAHYLHFFNKSLRWNANDELLNKIALKTEINFISKNTFQHHGIFAEKNTIAGEKLRAMTGTISLLNIGLSLEYYFNDLSQFIHPFSDDTFNPYITFGIRYALYNNNIQSTFGAGYNSDSDGNNPGAGILHEKYYQSGALKTGSGGALGFVLGIGTRYKLTEKIDLAGQFNWQVFLSDAVDGLQIKEPANKNNEWLLNFQVGVIYHLNFAEPLF